MADETNVRRKNTGGLHLTYKNPGEIITIEHAGEKLEIVFQGQSGKNTVLSFRAPISFKIRRPGT